MQVLYRATVTEREVTLDKTAFHQNAVGKDVLGLELDAEWEGAEYVVVTFYRGRASRNTGEICGQVLWGGADVEIPAGALTEAGELRLTVTGIWPDGSSIVTCEMEEGGEVCWSGIDAVDWQVDPGSDAVRVLVEMVKASAQAAIDAGEAAEAALKVAEDGALPEGGSEGQFVRKGADGAEWADVVIPDVDAAVSAHNEGADSHADIRAAVDALSQRLDLIANSDDETLDQLKELADFVKANREAIENLDPLPKGGEDGDVLTLVDGVPAWAEPQGGGSGGWTEDEVLAAVIACGLVTPVGDAAGNIYTDAQGVVYVL